MTGERHREVGTIRFPSGTVRHQRPDSPPSSDPTFYPQVTEDEVVYFFETPWPVGAAGNGAALARLPGGLFGDFPTSWTAEPGTPGGKLLDYDFWSEGSFGAGSPQGSGMTEDFDNDGVLNLIEFALGMNPLVSDPELLKFVVEGNQGIMTFGRDLLLKDFPYVIEYSTDLVQWDPAPDVLVSTDDYIETRKASVPLPLGQRFFMRLKVDTD